MSFHVGQLVVCVDSGARLNGPSRVIRGGIYTIKAVMPDIGGVELSEVDPRPFLGWQANRFRPVDETRLEVFRKIAANPRIEVDA